MSQVAVLFARNDSIYKNFPHIEVWDAQRDARKFSGGLPVVAHPPCRAWGRLRYFAKPRDDEKELGLFAISQVQRLGGVLEHPAGSTLWNAGFLPTPGDFDIFGGYTLPVLQMWWGHRAEKATWLYIVGVHPQMLPPMPYVMGDSSHVVQSRKRHDCRPHISKADRERTPEPFAKWLCEIARRAKTYRQVALPFPPQRVAIRHDAMVMA